MFHDHVVAHVSFSSPTSRSIYRGSSGRTFAILQNGQAIGTSAPVGCLAEERSELLSASATLHFVRTAELFRLR